MGQTPASSAGGLFGAAKPAAPTGSLFGNTTAGATSFGGGFGANTATSGFGAAATPSTGFGGFGTKPAVSTGGLFGNTANTLGGATGGFGGGLGSSFGLGGQTGLSSFGANMLQQPQQTLIATVDNNTYGGNPLFDLSKPAVAPPAKPPTTPAHDARQDNTHHYPTAPLVVSRIKLRGFHVPVNKARKVNYMSPEDLDRDALLGAGAFRARPSVHKLVLDNPAEIDQFLGESKRKNSVKVDPVTKPAEASTETSNKASTEGYYMSPSLEVLQNMSKESLKKVQDFVVGRTGYGEIKFDHPVDLSDVALTDILGKLVMIDEKKVHVYPDQQTKPVPGQQLNVGATVTLEKCHTLDKDTGKPITDAKHPRVVAFEDKLKKRDNTEFINYDAESAKWTFKVKEF